MEKSRIAIKIRQGSIYQALKTYRDLKFYELIICNWKPGVITCAGQSMKTFFIYNVAELQHHL